MFMNHGRERNKETQHAIRESGIKMPSSPFWDAWFFILLPAWKGPSPSAMPGNVWQCLETSSVRSRHLRLQTQGQEMQRGVCPLPHSQDPFAVLPMTQQSIPLLTWYLLSTYYVLDTWWGLKMKGWNNISASRCMGSSFVWWSLGFLHKSPESLASIITDSDVFTKVSLPLALVSAPSVKHWV